MSDLNETKRQLEKAGYYFGESNSELEHVHTHSKRLGEIIRGIAALLPPLGEEWSESAKISQQNVDRADKIATGMESIFHLLESMPEEFGLALGTHTGNAFEGACTIQQSTEFMRSVTSMVPPHELNQLSGQFTDRAANVERTTSLNSQTQQHFTDAGQACTEYIQRL